MRSSSNAGWSNWPDWSNAGESSAAQPGADRRGGAFVSLNLRLKDLLGPVTRVKKKKKERPPPPRPGCSFGCRFRGLGLEVNVFTKACTPISVRCFGRANGYRSPAPVSLLLLLLMYYSQA